MRSAARLTYEQVQAAQDAGTDPEGVPRARSRSSTAPSAPCWPRGERRGTLDLDLPERRVLLDAKGKVHGGGAARRGSTATG